MRHPAIKELYDLLKVRDWTEFCPERDRQVLLETWLDKWIVELSQSESVINPKRLNLAELDDKKYILGCRISESLTEDCTDFKIEKNQISAHVVGLRRAKK